MKLNLNCFVNNNANFPYILAAYLTNPLKCIITVTYVMSNTQYKEVYFINFNGIGNLWDRSKYRTYKMKREDFIFNGDLQEAYNNEQHMFLYYGKDVTGKTDNEFCHILFKGDISLLTLGYNIDIDIKNGNLPDIIDLTSKATTPQEQNAGTYRELNIDDDNFISLNSFKVNRYLDKADILKAWHINDTQTLVLDRGSYDNRSVMVGAQELAYELNTGYIFIGTTSDTKLVFFYGINNDDFDVYLDDDNFYIVCHRHLYLSLMFKDSFVNIVPTSSLDLESKELFTKDEVTNEHNIGDSFGGIIPNGFPMPIKADNGRLYWACKGLLIDAFGRNSLDKSYGTTGQRPINGYNGMIYFDTTLNKPIWWTGTKWVDATGADV